MNSISTFLNTIINPADKPRTIWLWSIPIIVLSCLATVYLGSKIYLAFGLILLCIFAFRWEWFLFYLFLAVEPLTTLIFWNYKTYINYFILVLIVFFWLARKILFPGKRFEVSVELLLYSIVFMAFTLLTSLHGGLTRDEIEAIIRFLFFFGLVLIIYDIYQPRDTPILMAFASIPLVIQLYYMIKEFSNTTSIPELLMLYRLKPTGYFDNINGYAGILINILPFWIAVVIWSRRKWLRMIALALSLILSAGLLLSNSRAAFAGMILTVFMFFLWSKRLKTFLVICMIVLILFMSVPILKVIVSLAFRVEAGTTSRDEIWASTIQMIQKNFWFGVGIGNYTEEFTPYFPTVGVHNFFKEVSHAHNQILMQTAEMGIWGLLLILTLYYLPLRAGVKALRITTGSAEQKVLVYGVLSGILATFGRSFFELGMLAEGSFHPEIYFWTLFAMILKMSQNRFWDKSIYNNTTIP